jgi:hypothetical protein
MGETDMSYSDEIITFLDSILDEAGTIEDGEPNEMPNIPEQKPDVQIKQVEDDIGGVGLDEPELGPEVAEIAADIVDDILVEQDSVYQTYFRGVMKKHGATDIKHMSSETKRAFFKDVSAGWKSRKKVKEESVKIVSEDTLYKEYKKYFTYMLEQCGIEDFNALTEVEQAEFMSLVNEAFQTMNELMQKPGAPITNPMSGYGNMIDKMKNQVRPERRVKQMAAAKQVRRPEVRT